MPAVDALKKTAAEAAAGEVRDGMRLGLGTGSTVQFVLEILGARARGGLRLQCVPTSERTQKEAERLGIPLTTLEAAPELDLTIDGADEIDERLQLIKGGGGALLREKVVASASRRVVIVADGSKLVRRLGGTFAVPIEVVPFSVGVVRPRVERMGAQVALRESGGHPILTDNGNWILDAKFPEIQDAEGLEGSIKGLPGVAEVGIFCGLAHRAYLGLEDGVRIIDRTSDEAS